MVSGASRDHETRRIRRAASPLEATRSRRGLKVASAIHSPGCGFPFATTFAQRLRAASTFGLRRMPATRKAACRGTRKDTNTFIEP